MKRPDYISAYEWSQMTNEEQTLEWRSLTNEETAPRVRVETALPKKPRQSMKAAPPVLIHPRTIDEAFALVNGELMRRRVARVEVVQHEGERYTREVEHFERCGDRVRFGANTYRAAVIVHYLRTGELVPRAPRAKPAPRFKAQVREGERVIHIGYFDTLEQRNAAVFAYRMGVKLD